MDLNELLAPEGEPEPEAVSPDESLFRALPNLKHTGVEGHWPHDPGSGPGWYVEVIAVTVTDGGRASALVSIPSVTAGSYFSDPGHGARNHTEEKHEFLLLEPHKTSQGMRGPGGLAIVNAEGVHVKTLNGEWKKLMDCSAGDVSWPT